VRIDCGDPIPTWQDAQEKLLEVALTRFRGNKTHAARALGISLRTLRNKIREFRLERFSGLRPVIFDCSCQNCTDAHGGHEVPSPFHGGA
jgi:hypothetical protein